MWAEELSHQIIALVQQQKQKNQTVHMTVFSLGPDKFNYWTVFPWVVVPSA